MEAGTLHLHIHSIYCTPKRPFRYHRSSSPTFPRFSISCSFQSEGFKGPKPSRNLVADWVSNNDNVARSLPIYVGGFSLLAVLFNRTVSGIAPVADASRFWQSLSAATCCRSLVVIYEESCICQIGVAAESLISGEAENVDAKKLIQGTLYRGIMKSGAQSYLANLSLYPGRSELPFLPSNTQAVILQPLGDKGIVVIGGDTIRGFSTADQAWISLIGDKLDATLTKSVTGDALMTPDKGR
ncbi:protein COFACTOR ASSEMBLY OF COMPLEX C SUBUNIT B CCB4, chloroplastic-like isoform X2 [Chenopodium quinoa]|uniref:protein COFACTOR ASSEMBLY OF COMPLEX C SUBUNIT B CCB4, chloroplastic-like isoform X2 n=1 Tax=Chenopodium quinoa TaxID=63459 RepID=UPI000B778A59|nr:protein COFACTOR ASSEMBLY OF COMPLEX C SUBUNIT B CCB4, chloroplastic-like isoform X2 [Chenopodium quinoa]